MSNLNFDLFLAVFICFLDLLTNRNARKQLLDK